MYEGNNYPQPEAVGGIARLSQSWGDHAAGIMPKETCSYEVCSHANYLEAGILWRCHFCQLSQQRMSPLARTDLKGSL